MRLLVVTAVAAERDAAAAHLSAHPARLGRLRSLQAQAPLGSTVVVAGGVGPAAAAASTSAALAADTFDLVLSAGIAGGFPPALIGGVVVASRSVLADLGVETAEGFVALSAIGIGGTEAFTVDAAVHAELLARAGGSAGTVLTVTTVTGTDATATLRQQRYPDVVAEAMEGGGVATAAQLHGVAFAEVRTISNLVGPRDRASWRIDEALRALGGALAAITSAPWPGA